MAKQPMFYTLDEAAEKLGVSPDEVKELAARGELQQFRDRDKLMFKRDQVDQLASGATRVDDSGPISLADSGDTDAIDLRSDETAAGTKVGDAREATGISVFDADEIEPADPGAQTQVTSAADDEDLALESVGSGSGLLDLTRESDDTSLGAELLDEIYPGGTGAGTSAGTAAGTGVGTGTGGAVGSSGVFESAIAMESSAGASASLPGAVPADVAPEGAAPTMAVSYAAEEDDPAGSGMATGLLLGATIALIIGLIVAIGGMAGVRSPITEMMTASGMQSLAIWCGGLLVLSIVFGVVGFVLGKAMAR